MFCLGLKTLLDIYVTVYSLHRGCHQMVLVSNRASSIIVTCSFTVHLPDYLLHNLQRMHTIPQALLAVSHFLLIYHCCLQLGPTSQV